MKNPRGSIERFCAQHPNFGIPNLIKYVTIANVVFWIIGAVNPTLLSYLAFNPEPDALYNRGECRDMGARGDQPVVPRRPDL